MPRHLKPSILPALALAGCASEQTPTGPPGPPGAGSAAVGAALSFGPFPGRTTVFVDVANRTGTEDGSRAHPFNTLSEGLAAAKDGSVSSGFRMAPRDGLNCSPSSGAGG
jgi:hypothetical protein